MKHWELYLKKSFLYGNILNWDIFFMILKLRTHLKVLITSQGQRALYSNILFAKYIKYIFNRFFYNINEHILINRIRIISRHTKIIEII